MLSGRERWFGYGAKKGGPEEGLPSREASGRDRGDFSGVRETMEVLLKGLAGCQFRR